MCGCGCDTNAHTSEAPAIASRSQVVRVDDMSCGQCVGTINKVVKARWPLADVSADLDNKPVTIVGGGSGTELGSVIREAGYNPVI